MKYGPHGIPTGYNFTLSRTKYHGFEQWKIKLSGGPGKETDHPVPRFLNAEIMRNPYCRGLDKNGDELFRIPIFNGTVGNRNFLRLTFGKPDAVFPVSRQTAVVADDLDQIAFGYDFYEAEAACSNAGGPAEIVCPLSGGKPFFRKVFAPGDCEAVIESPINKKIVSLIPKDIPEYEAAVQYAELNHYFLEGEEVSFRTFCLNEEATDAELVLENAFKEKIKTFHSKTEKFFHLSPLAPGVYHIYAKLYRNKLFLASVRRAFEIIPNDPGTSAQQLSGLPDIYPDGFLSDSSEHFNPWGDTLCDVSHYTRGGNMYTFNTDHRFLKLLKVYHREWISRCRPDFASAEQNDFIRENACLIQSRNIGGVSGRFYLHVSSIYEEKQWIRDQVRSFAGKQLSFDELYPSRWSEWLDFIAPRCRELFRQANQTKKGTLAAEYLSAATYGCIYKGPNYTRLLGVDLRNGKYGEILTGFAVMEDYPYSSKYPLSRSTWQYGALSMEGQDVRWLPQVWGLNAETADGRVVYSHPPYGISETPADFFFNRITELLYDTAWFDGKEFRYWNGNGLLHSSEWTPAMFDAMLKAFAIYRNVKPVRPLRTACYVYSRAACDAHEYFYERNENMVRGGSMVNTAEEFAGYLYEQARKDGQPGGFHTRMEWLAGLTGEDTSLLVLPPLKGVPEKELDEIRRRLHKEGVNLICSEDSASLADLFDLPHAEVLLKKDGKPFLVIKKNEKASAAFFTDAPSMQSRGRDRTGGSGQKALDMEVNFAAQRIMRRLSECPLDSDCGSLTPFVGDDGHAYTFIREDSWPEKGHRIRPALTWYGKPAGDFVLEEYESRLVRLD